MLREKIGIYLEGVNGKHMEQGLDNISRLMDYLGRPDRGLKIIHITGTNGKGSTCEFLSCMLQEAGYKVGTFISPYFDSPCECIRINGRRLSESSLVGYMTQIEEELVRLEGYQQLPSGFEILTALALQYFKDYQVDWVILEVGLGGRLDATNIIGHSIAAVFTSISRDHTQILGNTLEAIAKEKAGIIKKDSLVITAVQQPEVMKVLEEDSREKGNSLWCLQEEELCALKTSDEGTFFMYHQREYQLKMLGEHQAYNCALAVKVLEVLKDKGFLKITGQQLRDGAYMMQWPGRFEKVREVPNIYLDGAHNIEGIRTLKKTLEALVPAYTIGVMGILKDKEVIQMLHMLQGQFDELIVTKPEHIRALDEKGLKEQAERYFENIVTVEKGTKALSLAIDKANHREEKVRIVCFGSLYLIAELRRYLNNSEY